MLNPSTTQDIVTFIPVNDVIPENGYYSYNQIVELLRNYHTNPQAVYFIADMMEL